MKAASQLLIGTHDFRGFSSERNLDKSCVRQIFDITIEEKENELILRYWGNGFLYNMVRILTGTLLEIGGGKKEIDIINDIFQNKIRESAGFMVPPNGLFLEKVLYQEK
jgi:tRNA pseudouridine38-40 synthase